MYCPLAWHFYSKLSQNKRKKFKSITNDCKSDYKLLHNETGKSAMEIRTLGILPLKIVNILNSLRSNFVKDIFDFSSHSAHKKHDIFVHTRNTSNCCRRSLRTLGSHT